MAAPAAAGPAMAAAVGTPPPPPPQAEEAGGRRQAASRARQAELWARARSLCRRLRALQARQVERHVRQQLAGLARAVGPRPGSPGLPPALPVGRAAALGSELRQLAADATARLRAAQRACDSDATDSSSVASTSADAASAPSSAASSDSEGPDCPSPPPLPRRHDDGWCLAKSQWATERAAIICRWTWLQAQVSDLEYRIRQQTDVYKQLRSNKGPVVLGSLQHEDVTKQHSRLGSAVVVNSKRSKVLSPHTSHLKVPNGDRQSDFSPCIPSYLLQNAEKQNSRLAQSLRNLVCQSPSFTPINGSPEPPKACTSRPQVNGISNCFHKCPPSSSSQDGTDGDKVLKKPRQLNNSLHAAPSSLDSSCVAARIRPICRYKKRRLVRVSDVSYLSRKPQKPLTMKCNCELPSSCILCDCSAPIQTVEPGMSLKERVALLDSGFHPRLSFSHGHPLHFHFEALLREEPRLSHQHKTLKLPHRGMKDCTNILGSSSHSASGSLLKGSAYHSLLVPSSQTPKPGPLHHVPSLCLENAPTPHFNQVTSSLALPAKKKKVECCYDINNIVIPMSMAAATRVEKLQYKEILTPSWRMVDPKELEILAEGDSELEDTSDEAYLNHHQIFEEMEQTHWDSWTGTVSHKRGNRGSNKADGRWIPQPASLDTVSQHLDHLKGANSTMGPLSPELPNIPQSLLIKGRSRGGLSFSEDSSPEMDNDIQSVQPWEPRTFPLSDAEYQALHDSPQDAPGKQAGAIQQLDFSSSQGLRTNSINPGASTPKEPLVPGWQVQSNGSKHQDEFVGQHCVAPRLISNR